MITIDDMIEERIYALEGVFEMDDLSWYIFNIDNNHLSLDDSIGYLHRTAWRDVQHQTVKPIYWYFKTYVEKYGMRL